MAIQPFQPGELISEPSQDEQEEEKAWTIGKKQGDSFTLEDPDGISREIKIAGRADRFDIHVNDETSAAVIDYKNHQRGF